MGSAELHELLVAHQEWPMCRSMLRSLIAGDVQSLRHFYCNDRDKLDRVLDADIIEAVESFLRENGVSVRADY